MSTKTIIKPVTRVYVGKDNCCRCGCKGNYHEQGSVGFVRAVNRAFKLLEEKGDSIIDDQCETYMNIITGDDRCIVLYFDGE